MTGSTGRRVRTGARSEPAALVAVAVGGALGALGRYGLAQAVPAVPGRLPWATLTANVVGCLAMGVLVTLLAAREPAHPLLRPLLGVGVLGGFTTFSAYAVEVTVLVDAGHAGTAVAYLAVTPVAALAAAWAGTRTARRLLPVGASRAAS